MPSIAEVASRVAAASGRLADQVVQTPLVTSEWLSGVTGGEVRLKLENLQPTGSFKLRGATHALLAAPRECLARGVLAASSGNHGLALASAARRLGVAATVFVPSTAPAARRAAIVAQGAAVEVHGDDCVDSERAARAAAAERGMHYVSPYNDLDVVAGQGTIGVELLAQWRQVERIYVALGGGGLVGGVGALVRTVVPEVEIVACSPLASPAMAECVRAGAIVEVPCGPTLADSTAGGVEAGAITFELCRAVVDRYLEFSEEEIAAALLGSLEHQHLLVEGAAALALAACLREEERDGRRSAVIVCGGNLPLDVLGRLLAAR